MILAVHLCGALSCKAVDIFNENMQATFLALKPCCLPGKQAVKQKLEWTLGRHSFTAADLYGIKSKRLGPASGGGGAKTTEEALFAVLPLFSGTGSGGSSSSSGGGGGGHAYTSLSTRYPSTIGMFADVSFGSVGGAAGVAVEGRKRGNRSAAAQKRRHEKRKVRVTSSQPLPPPPIPPNTHLF